MEGASSVDVAAPNEAPGQQAQRANITGALVGNKSPQAVLNGNVRKLEDEM